MIVTQYAGLLFLIVLLGELVRRLRGRVPKGYKLVRGPRGWPVVGNALQLGRYPQNQLKKWAGQYGELFQVRLGWENWVFVNSADAVRELFDRQSANTSGRQPQPVTSDAFSGESRLLLLTYGSKWRKMRSIIHRSLTPKACSIYKPSQEFEAIQLIHDIATDDAREDNFYMHVRRYTTSVVLLSTYGLRVPIWDCETIREIYTVLNEFSVTAQPGAYIADLFPPLGRLPEWLQWWRPASTRAYKRHTAIFMKYWNSLKDKIEKGRAPECLVKHIMETDLEKQGIGEVEACWAAGSMIEAGSETTSSALNSSILCLAAYPDVQDRADEELSTVVGDERSPTFEDESALPYIRAMGKEILRIRPVTNIGTPHYTTSDVIYKDHFIPKDTVVCINQYALHFDPEQWDNPNEFDPSRYLAYPHKVGVYAAGGDAAQHRDHYDFGAGRRICPGMHLAENSLFITLAKLLWAFRIEPSRGPDGKPLAVNLSDTAYEDGVNTVPKPFKARFVPRSEARMRVLLAEWDQAQKDGFYLGSAKVNTDGVVCT